MDSGTLNIVTQMIMLFAIGGIGYACKKLKMVGPEMDRGLSEITLSVTMPALIIGSVLTAEVLPTTEEILQTFVAAVLMHIILLGLALIVVAVFRVPVGSRGAYRFMVIFGNVGFLGFPVVSAIYGPDALIYAAIFHLPFNFIAFTLGPVLITQDREGAEPERITIKTFMTPMIITCIVAVILVLLGVRNIPFISETTMLLGNMTTPAAMMVIGFQLANLPIRDMLGGPKLWAICAFRLLVNPLLVWLMFSPFLANPVLLGAIVVISAMPVANLSTMFSLRYGIDTKNCSQGIFVSTLLSIVTIPLLLVIMG